MPTPEIEAARRRVVEAKNNLEMLMQELGAVRLLIDSAMRSLERANEYYLKLQQEVECE
jgi:dsDNA-specific endonuclease/ATPase MutS2